MTNKLRTIFSPRNLVMWLCLLILIITLPEITRPSMSQTEAIVTLLCIDKIDNQYEIAANILAPSQNKTANTQVYKSNGRTLAESIDKLSLTIGKDIGLAQCEVMAIGENLCEENVMNALDYLTRTKQVGRNSLLITYTGEPADFAKAISDLTKNNSLKLEDMMNFNDKNMLIKECNIEAFYKGYYGPTKIGLMPKLQLSSSDMESSIEVSSQQEQGTSTSSNTQEKKFIVNDGSTCIFKNGKEYLTLDPELSKKVNLFLNDHQKGFYVVENVNDKLFSDATITYNIGAKKVNFKPNFKNGTPVYEVDVGLTVLIEEVVEKEIDKQNLQRNKEFFTNAAIEKLKDSVKSDMLEVVEFCKENELDLINVYKYFNAYKNKEFKEYLKTAQEKYLNGIDYKFTIEVSSSF